MIEGRDLILYFFLFCIDGHPLMTGSRYTLMTLPTNTQSDQTRSRVPGFQCPGKI